MLIFRWVVFALVILFILSLLAVWSYGHFARRSVGEKTFALPAVNPHTNLSANIEGQEAQATTLDKWVSNYTNQHPNQSGAAFLEDPLLAFVARARTARIAERSLDIQYYLWHHDITGRLLQNELYAAANRGVRVRLLLDDMSKSGRDEELLALDSHPNIEVRLFNPGRNRTSALRRAFEIGLRFFSFNRRMHNKAWIADNRLALVGGRNIGDEYFGAATKANFRDTDLLLLGPAVAETSTIFDSFWNADEVIPLAALYKKGTRWSKAEFAAKREAWRIQAAATPWGKELNQIKAFTDYFAEKRLTIHWSPNIKVLSDPPAKAAPLARKRQQAGWLLYDVMALLYSAKEETWIISPYFVPGNEGALLLSGQALRGLQVRVLTNSLAATNVPMVHAGYAGYRKGLLNHGVELYELKPSFGKTKRELLNTGRASLHSKAFLIDKHQGFVGSFNLDPRSAQLNTEMGVVFEDAGLAQELERFFLASTQPNTSWKLALNANQELTWQGEQLHHKKDPEANLGLRLLVKLLSYLPIESQL